MLRSGPVAQQDLGRVVASMYRRPQEVLQHILTATSAFTNLIPTVDIYTYESGRQLNLLHLSGTIPIYFKGQQYNIPVCIWLLENHPGDPPVCYVVPTETMLVKASKHVDGTGRVFLPYLHEWNGASTLYGLIGVMIQIFSETPPLYSAPQPQFTPVPPPRPPPPVVQQQQQPPPIPPPPQQQQQQQHHIPAPAPPVKQQSQNDDLQFAQIMHDSLVSAVQESARREFSEARAAVQSSMEKGMHNQIKLNNNAAFVSRKLQQLEQEVRIAQSAVAEFEARIAQFPPLDDKPINVDEVVITTAPLYDQLLVLMAEDNTYDDILYQFGKAVESGKMDIATYLKNVRVIARKQFQTRALLKKGREKARLVGQ